MRTLNPNKCDEKLVTKIFVLANRIAPQENVWDWFNQPGRNGETPIQKIAKGKIDDLLDAHA